MLISGGGFAQCLPRRGKGEDFGMIIGGLEYYFLCRLAHGFAHDRVDKTGQPSGHPAGVAGGQHTLVRDPRGGCPGVPSLACCRPSSPPSPHPQPVSWPPAGGVG